MRKWIEWLDVRDKVTMTGNCTSWLGWEKALALLEKCDHPEAQWLWKTIGHCDGVDDILATLDQMNDIRSVTYRTHIRYTWTRSNVKYEDCLDCLFGCADAGNSLAQLLVCDYSVDAEVRIKYARMAVVQGERRAMFLLGYLIKDEPRASFGLYRRGAELEDVSSLLRCRNVTTEPLLRHRCICVLHGKYNMLSEEFYASLKQQYDLFVLDGWSNEEILIEFDKVCWKIPGKGRHWELELDLHLLVLNWKQKARDAINTWTLIAKRFGLYKDVHLLISQMVWTNFSAFSRTK